MKSADDFTTIDSKLNPCPFKFQNGGEVLSGGNNYPLRGAKMTLWEGGMRVPTFLYGDILNKKGYVNNK